MSGPKVFRDGHGWRFEANADGAIVVSRGMETRAEAEQAASEFAMRERVMTWLASAEPSRFSASIPIDVIRKIHDELVKRELLSPLG